MSLASEKEELIVKYLAARAAPATAATAKEKQTLASALDAIYWRMVESVVAQSITITPDLTLKFSERDARLLDFGLLDPRLVGNAPENFEAEMEREKAIVGLPQHFYLSEWLIDRVKRFNLEATIAATAENQRSAADVAEPYQAIAAYFAAQNGGQGLKLPGVSATAMEALLSGRLDKQIATMSAGLRDHPERPALIQRSRLAKLRREMVAQAKSVLPATPLIGKIDENYREAWLAAIDDGKTVIVAAENEFDDPIDPESDPRVAALTTYLGGELRFLRTIIPLGAMAGGVRRSQSVLLDYCRRVTRQDTAAIIDKMRWCDRNCYATPVVVLAPFVGRGVYEWDRDSLVIGLSPVDGPADAVANAVGNFSMMLDSLQHAAAVKTAYKAAFPAVNFQQSFQRDYRQWLTQVAQGDAAAMPPEKLAFFGQHVALDLAQNPALALAPPELKTLSPTMRALLCKQLEKQVEKEKGKKGVWLAYWRLALLLWLDDKNAAALPAMANAARHAPNEICVTFGVALLLAQAGQKEKARQMFSLCAERGAKTIWKFYAEQFLRDN
ncbi:hypothetical protein AGMMS49959_01600 [Planctomycetales bacterium]|nr:hypothetical protein AGMMS49959_01600 [Planctomycetales bacterium]